MHVALQETKCEIYKAHRMAQHLIKPLELERSAEKYKSLWNQTKKEEAICMVSITCLAHDNKVFYPNIYSIILLLTLPVLILLLTLPVGSCSCERSFSALRRLKTCCRNTMTEERLDAVAIGHINQERSLYVQRRYCKCGTALDIVE